MRAPAEVPVPSRVGRRRRRALPAALFFALLLSALPALAQQQDTIPREREDSARIAIPPEQMVRDTLPPTDTLQVPDADSLRPAPHLPRYPQPERVGFAMGRWEWDRAALQRYHGLSMLELLERIPGLVVTRGGGFGSPASVSFAGQGGGRLRVFRDGFELDPLHSGSYDLQHIGLLDLDNVRVERTPADLRIHLRTFQLADRRPFSEVEIGSGNFQARFLRALMSRVVGSRSVVTATYDLASAGGYRFDEPFTFTSGRLRWDTALGERSGFQLEFRQAGATLESAALPTDFDRRELIFRARTELAPGLTLEALGGSTSHRPSGFDVDSLGRFVDVTESGDTLDLRVSSRQALVRALLERGFGFVEAGARLRVDEELGFTGPRRELTARAGIHPLPLLTLEGELRSTGGEAGEATEMRATGRFGSFLGLSLFGTVTAGERFVALRRDTLVTVADTQMVDEVPTPIERQLRRSRFDEVRAGVGGIRLGAEWESGWARLGVAAIASEASAIVPFGAPFDRGMPVVLGEEATGVEAYGSLSAPGALRALRLDGWYTRWSDGGGRPYLPAQQGRVALVYHDRRRAGQFEPLLRLEAVHRGESFVPTADRAGYVEVEPYTMLNFSMQLRILDVRAFLLYENVLREVEAADLPQRLLPGPRTLYGVRWFFRN